MQCLRYLAAVAAAAVGSSEVIVPSCVGLGGEVQLETGSVLPPGSEWQHDLRLMYSNALHTVIPLRKSSRSGGHWTACNMLSSALYSGLWTAKNQFPATILLLCL